MTEETIQQYQPQLNSPANGSERLVKEVKVSPNGIRFHFNSLNEFINRFKEGLVGCLGCGSEQNIFDSCLGRRATGLSEFLFQELLCHIPCSQLTSRNAY